MGLRCEWTEVYVRLFAELRKGLEPLRSARPATQARTAHIGCKLSHAKALSRQKAAACKQWGGGGGLKHDCGMQVLILPSLEEAKCKALVATWSRGKAPESWGKAVNFHPLPQPPLDIMPPSRAL